MNPAGVGKAVQADPTLALT